MHKIIATCACGLALGCFLIACWLIIGVMVVESYRDEYLDALFDQDIRDSKFKSKLVPVYEYFTERKESLFIIFWPVTIIIIANFKANVRLAKYEVEDKKKANDDKK